MQKVTSILGPAKSNLVMTFEYFSSNFKFDLCHDFSFWKTETGRCIPKEMNDEETFYYYPFTPLCNRTKFDCMNTVYESYQRYCPNKDKSCEGYESYGWEDPFFCNNSKTCIPNGKVI